MRRVIVESPYGARNNDGSRNEEQVNANVAYARRCLADCLRRGEAPFASHLLYTQDGVLRDEDNDERTSGINAGFAWHECADAVTVYMDLGVSSGMKAGIDNARRLGLPIEERYLD